MSSGAAWWAAAAVSVWLLVARSAAQAPVEPGAGAGQQQRQRQRIDDAVGFGGLPAAAARGSGADDAAGFGPAAVARDDAAGFGPAAVARDDAAGGGDPSVAEPAARLTIAGFARAELSGLLERSDSVLRYGRLTLETALTYQREQLSLVAGVHAETDLITRWQPGQMRAVERETNGTWLLPWELYLRYLLGPITLTMGRQIAAFGHALFFPLLDVANPRDQRVPLLGVPAERRLPVWMTRFAIDKAAHRFELLAIHEADYRFRPPPFGLYSVVPVLLQRELDAAHRPLLAQLEQADAVYRHEGQGVALNAAQALARYRYDGSGLELALYGGWVVQQEGVIGFPAPNDWTRRPLELPVAHPHYVIVGGSVLSALGPFVTYLEVLGELWRPIALGDLDAPAPALTSQRQTWLRGTLGVRYEGIEDGVLALESTAGVVSPTLQPAGFAPLLPVAPWSVAGSYRQSFWRQQLELELLGLVLGPQPARGGVAARAQLSYRPFDAIRVQLAYLCFVERSGLSVISGFERQRIDASLRWDFAAP